MMPAQRFIFLLASIAFLAMQISGAHLHVNLHSDATELHGVHVHADEHNGHDHSGDIDISLYELGAGWSKSATLFLAVLVALFSTAWVIPSKWWPPPELTPSYRNQFRWRPPLRGPPVFSP